MAKRRGIRVHPYVWIILNFIIVIMIGTFMLMLPIASKDGKGIKFIDAFFTSTSCVCVTGLNSINIGERLTLFGKIVTALLIEIGGLSILTIAVYFFAILGGKIGIGNRYLLKEALNQNSIAGIVNLVKKIIMISLVIQLIGVILNYIALMKYFNYEFWTTLGYSLYHAVASFNNAGFDLFGGNSLIAFKDDVLLNISTMLLIVLGGLGFLVIMEVVGKRSIKRLSISSKIVLIITPILIISGMLVFKFSMYDEITWLQALFTSITCRTAGFTTVDLSQLPPAAYIMSLILMFIGASPCSTGGGIKTTTIVVIILTFIYYAQGKKPRVFHRRIADGTIFKAFVLFGISVLLVLFGTLVIGFVQPELGVEECLFEVISSFSTTGLTMGITNKLNFFNKFFIALLMFFGRLGPLTIIGVVNQNWMTQSNENIQYVEERIIVG